MKKREIKYDYLRTLAVFAIVMVHSIPSNPLNENQWYFTAAIQPLLLMFVGIYFMLSGLFLLQSGTENITGFYKNRFLNIVIPFVFYCGLYYWYYEIHLGVEKAGWQHHLITFGRELLEGTIPMASHLWFMYVILSLYLCAPFLARLMKAMSDQDLKLFLVTILAVQGACTYGTVLGIQLWESLQYMIFKGWFIYFILGYALKRLYGNRNYAVFGLLGVSGFFITMVQKIYTPDFLPGIHDLALTMIAMASSVFLFFERYGDWRIKALERAAVFISRHSYSLYLIHYLVIGEVARKAVEQTLIRHYYLPKIISVTFLAFCISLLLAWIADETVLRLLKYIGSGRKAPLTK